MDAFARGAVTFQAAIAPAPWTLPSHASMFTGRYPTSLSTDYKIPLDGADSTLAEVLAARGYATAGFVGNVWYTSWESGLTRGFHEFHDYQRSFEQVVKSTHLGRTDLADALFRSSSWRQALGALRRLELREVPRPPPAPNTAEYVTNRFLDWHARRDPSRPWFAFLNYFDAHEPYLPEEPFAVCAGTRRAAGASA
jgi:arylsulfatase A-like enzyme